MKQCRLYKSRLWSTKRPEARNTGEPLLRSTEHTHTQLWDHLQISSAILLMLRGEWDY